jgi:superfamily II DNA or RNA helicase
MSEVFQRLPTGSSVRVRGSEWRVASHALHENCESLRLDGSGAANAGLTRTFLRPFDRVEAAVSTARVRTVSRRRWAKGVAGILATAHPFGGLTATAGAAFELLPYQLEPALAMLRHGRFRILVADEVGLGKTVQAGIVLNELAAGFEEFRALIVTPAGLREQWRGELQDRFALESTLADTGWLTASERMLPRDVNPWSLPGVYVTSLDLVKRPEVLRALEDVTWDASVIDEAHGATPGTERIAAARAITSRSRRVVLLTATPPDSEPDHLAALCRLGRAASDGPITIFRRSRQALGQARRRRSVLLAITPSPPERAMHRALEQYTALVWREAKARGDARASLAAVVLRKRALSCAGSLALSIRRRLALLGPRVPAGAQQLLLPLRDEDPLDDLAPDEAIGAAGLADAALEHRCLEAVGGLADRAAARESKLDALNRLLRRIHEPVIVFTEYRDTLARIAVSLPASHPRLLLHGGLTPRERDVVRREFTTTGAVLLATDAASEGLNLHHRCRTVVHFELPWTMTRLEQRTGRVDRLGQGRPVHEILFVANDTAERLVLAPLVRRARAAGARSGRPWAEPGESAVAAAVMDGTEVLPSPAAAGTETCTLDLRVEADREARRLARCRALRAGAGSKPGAGNGASTWVHVIRPVRAQAWVSLVSLLDRTRRVVHQEVVPLSVVVRDCPPTRRSKDVTGWARTVLRHGARAAITATRQHAHGACAEATELFRQHVRALLAREAFLESTVQRPREIVQAGLFERRALQAAEERIEIAARLGDDTALRRRWMILEGERLRLEVRIVAIRA